MESTRDLFQIFVRRFGLLNASCCDCCCGEEVSLVQSHILYEIRRQKSASMQQVANALGMDITTFSRQVKTLEKKGLVRKKPHPEDRRIYLLSLTTAGEELENRIDERMKAFIDNILSQFTEFERDMVVKSVQLLNKAILKAGACCLPE
ncbi:transcriptional regulator, MarR family [Thermincola ferriacetica]|uniref:Transcriptional regulator, MarR family n=2 Tax=Thermincola TaxID=278993 RepID=D5XB10_THEPJ|nr:MULTISPECIES: MarR family transcriptional regulator [Thermincola]ADG81330.1 transcriptional regulator, MarR family [Thermincola potens JR]KNZ69168.1 transcriptional regulator, MarR family [Thermincola ferriacetica]